MTSLLRLYERTVARRLASEAVPVVERELSPEALAALPEEIRDEVAAHDWRRAYVPETRELAPDEETGREEKLGGSVPYFERGDAWPTAAYESDEGDVELPLAFVGQWRDPRPGGDKRVLVQYFVTSPSAASVPERAGVDPEDVDARELFVVRRVRYPSVGRQDVLAPPPGVSAPEPARLIVRWVRRSELVGDVLREMLLDTVEGEVEDDEEELRETIRDAYADVHELGFGVSCETKLGGYGVDPERELGAITSEVEVANVFPGGAWSRGAVVNVERDGDGTLEVESHVPSGRSGP